VCPSKWAREVLLSGHAIKVGWHQKEGKSGSNKRGKRQFYFFPKIVRPYGSMFLRQLAGS
jgi:hypothetical protein